MTALPLATLLPLLDPRISWRTSALWLLPLLALAIHHLGRLVRRRDLDASAEHRRLIALTAGFGRPQISALAAAVAIVAIAAAADAGATVALWSLPAAVTLALLAPRLVSGQAPFGFVTACAALMIVAIAVALAVAPPENPAETVRLALQVAVPIVALTGLVMAQRWWFDVVIDLATSRDIAVTEAVTAERQRYAGEMHDLQGLELQKVMLQADLGHTLLSSDAPEALDLARETLRTIRATATEALAQTRAIAYGYRSVDLDHEIANVSSILEAAGLEAQVSGHLPAISTTAAHLIGQVLRESATNVLRYSQARVVRIELDPHTGAVRITDLGPARQVPGHRTGSGLDSLRIRAGAEGWALRAGADGDGWVVTLAPEVTP